MKYLCLFILIAVNLRSQNVNCITSVQLCSNASFSGNSSGSGTQELVAGNKGCLSTEHQSSWYIFEAQTSGSLYLEIATAADYDFAIWGPNVGCASLGSPVRCSFASGTGNTGLGNGATDVSEGTGGDRWVSPLTMTAGQTYIMLIDDYTANSSAFNISFNTSTAVLNCSLLPVELISFTVDKNASYNEVKWTTASEQNNQSFVLERSLDGINWNDLATIEGRGNATTRTDYEYKDYEQSDKIVYYRLKQVDYNLSYRYSDIVSVDPNLSDTHITDLGPNPTNKNISFNFHTPVKGDLSIQLINYTGSTVLEEEIAVTEGENPVEKNINNLPAGIYFIKMKFDETGFSTTSKIIKN